MLENPEAKQNNKEERVLVVAPVGKDARLICNLLGRAEITSEVCNSFDEVCAEFTNGAGAAIIAEEALTSAAVAAFAKLIGDQPSWSDFPLVVLTVSGEV